MTPPQKVRGQPQPQSRLVCCSRTHQQCVHLHPHLTALDTLVSTIEDQTGAQQLRLGLHTVAFSVQASLRKQQSSSASPVVTVSLLVQSPVCVQSCLGAPVPVESHRHRAPVNLHAGVEVLLHQGPQPRTRVAAPCIRPEGNSEGLGLIHQRRQGFLRINWREEQNLMKPVTWLARALGVMQCSFRKFPADETVRETRNIR